jgi:L-ascorbate metabolism protein UlaG (beta-lactamase superfamily)
VTGRPADDAGRRTGVRVTWLGHATVLLDLGGTRVVTDPLLRRRLGPLSRRSDLPLQAHVEDAEVVLLSHLHHDHADLPSLRRLAHAPVVTHPDNALWARRQGLDAPDVPDDDWVPLSATVDVRLVRADHDARPMPHRPNAANGMLLRGGGVVVWFAGDTSLHPEMEALADLAGAPVDLALLPIGGWGPRLSPGHMGPAEAVEAATRAGARHVVPVHYGTLHPSGWPRGRLAWTLAPAERFEELMAAGGGASAEVLDVGAATTVLPAGPARPADPAEGPQDA